MTKGVRGLLVAVALGAAVVILVSTPAAGWRDLESKPGRVVLVAWPGLTWEDVAKGRTPNLLRFARRFSFAAMSVRTIGPRTDPASAYASLGAGNRARGLGPENTGFLPRTVPSPTGGMVVIGMRDVREDNARALRYGARPGSLGGALNGAGLRTAAVGNADGLEVDPETGTKFFRKRRFAGLALADPAGHLDAGYFGDDLVFPDPADPAGYRADHSRMTAEFEEALRAADVILVEISDVFREGEVLFPAGTPARRGAEDDPSRAHALARDDLLFQLLLSRVDLERDALWVVAPVGPGPGTRERLTVTAAGGAGAFRGGVLTSATTGRPGLVALTDIGPGILRVLGMKAPPNMTGQAARPDTSTGGDRLKLMTDLQAAALFQARWATMFFLALVGAQALLYSMAVRTVGGHRRGGLWLRLATLALLAVPVSTFVWHAFHPERLGGIGAVLLLGVSAVFAAVSMAGPWRKAPSGPPTFLVTVTFLVIAIDVATGAHLELSTFLGYSPIIAGRFLGVGNLGFTVFATCGILAVSEAARLPMRPRVALAATVGAAAAFLNGAPTFGADFGGLISMVIGFGALLMLVSGKRVSLLPVVLLVLAAVAVALLAGYLDSLRPLDDQTHMGRFVSQLLRGGPGAVSDVILRKASANWGVITKSVLTLSLVVAGVFLTVVVRKPRGRLRLALSAAPGLKAGLLAAAAVNLAGFAVNDSGITIPAMGVAIMVPYLLAVMLSVHGPPPRLEEDERR